jgi:hypothetical protein
MSDNGIIMYTATSCDTRFSLETDTAAVHKLQ